MVQTPCPTPLLAPTVPFPSHLLPAFPDPKLACKGQCKSPSALFSQSCGTVWRGWRTSMRWPNWAESGVRMSYGTFMLPPCWCNWFVLAYLRVRIVFWVSSPDCVLAIPKSIGLALFLVPFCDSCYLFSQSAKYIGLDLFCMWSELWWHWF